MLGFPESWVGKESACNAGDLGTIAGSGRSAGKGISDPLQYSWASLVAPLVRIRLPCGRTGFDPWAGKIPWRKERLPTPVFWRREFHGLYSPWGSQRVRNDWATIIFTFVCLYVWGSGTLGSIPRQGVSWSPHESLNNEPVTFTSK